MGEIMTKRRSLHIGMNFVDPTKYGGWDGALSGCVNDANAMHDVAVSRGFDPQLLLDACHRRRRARPPGRRGRRAR
jgi:hypothetical protein